MTLTAMEPEPENENVVPLIVLTLDCPKAQSYLGYSNRVLQALTGVPVLRIDLDTDLYHLSDLVYPLSSESTMFRILSRHFPNQSWNSLPELVTTPEFTTHTQEVLLEVIRREVLRLSELPVFSELQVTPQLTTSQLLAAIRVVLINDALLRSTESSLEAVFSWWLPNAKFFKAIDDRSIPRPLWEEDYIFDDQGTPVCKTCATLMAIAGSVYICERCGARKDR